MSGCLSQIILSVFWIVMWYCTSTYILRVGMNTQESLSWIYFWGFARLFGNGFKCLFKMFVYCTRTDFQLGGITSGSDTRKVMEKMTLFKGRNTSDYFLTMVKIKEKKERTSDWLHEMALIYCRPRLAINYLIHDRDWWRKFLYSKELCFIRFLSAKRTRVDSTFWISLVL